MASASAPLILAVISSGISKPSTMPKGMSTKHLASSLSGIGLRKASADIGSP
jgi:hypothetical protein